MYLYCFIDLCALLFVWGGRKRDYKCVYMCVYTYIYIYIYNVI